MTVKRFFKKCEEFSICSEIADSGDYFFDGYPDNTTIFHICTKGSVPLPTRTWVPINEEIWLPIRSLGLKSCDMGCRYWSQASILSNLSGWSRFRFLFTSKSPGGKYIHRVWLWAYSFHDILFIAGQVWIYPVVHTPIHILPAIVVPVILSIRPMGRYTHF